MLHKRLTVSLPKGIEWQLKYKKNRKNKKTSFSTMLNKKRNLSCEEESENGRKVKTKRDSRRLILGCLCPAISTFTRGKY